MTGSIAKVQHPHKLCDSPGKTGVKQWCHRRKHTPRVGTHGVYWILGIGPLISMLSPTSRPPRYLDILPVGYT